MTRTAPRISGFATGWLLLAGLALLLATPPPASSQAAAPKAKPKKTQAAGPKKVAPAKRAEAPRSQLRRRDPFRSLVVRPEDLGGGRPLPPGKPGLVIAQLNLNGVVVMRAGNIAVVTMLGRNRAYFLRARDELFDGYVSQINPDSVVFKEKTTDPFGKEYEREVVKLIPGPGAKR